MRKIRIGKDILFVWSILTNGEPLSLSGRNLRLVLTTPFKRSVDLAFETAENTLKFYYKGVEQKAMGLYRLTLWENYGKEGQTALDACNAFELVPATCYESGNNKEGLDTETVNLSGNIEVFTQGEISGSGIPDAPFDGKTYGRNQGEWVPIENTSGDFVTGDELAQALESYATKEEIPNVDSFITNTVDNLINYYKKTETYTQEEINTRLGQITTINFKVVESLPETGESNLIYLVKRAAKATSDDLYDEFIWIAEDSKYEKIGSTTVDLSNYYNKSEADSKFALKVDIADKLTKTEAAQTYQPRGNYATIEDLVIYDADNVMFKSDLTITADVGVHTVGSSGSKTLATTGKSVKQVMDMLFAEEKNPSVTQPSVNLTSSSMGAKEVGTMVTPNYNASLNPGSYQYGPATEVSATSWNITDTNSNSSANNNGTFTEFQVVDGTNYSISATAQHTEGTIPKTNLGNEYPQGKIAAGNKSANRGSITGYRNSFYGTFTNKDEMTSATIRTLGKSNRALSNGATFNISIPVGALRVAIAYPATLRPLTSVLDSNGLNAQIVGSFKGTTIDVEGANGYDAISYKVYYLDYAVPNDTANTYKVTI